MLHFKGKNVAPEGKKCCTSKEGMLHFKGKQFFTRAMKSTVFSRFLAATQFYTVLYISTTGECCCGEEKSQNTRTA
jgi:hypothetical protein